ncbi:uncharacterized protein [Amphiura filiformis]|uniref:uncharacterized protein n=1 Tax=Amphiura filiformis TaxID=82378 RepID=UPI003B21098C
MSKSIVDDVHQFSFIEAHKCSVGREHDDKHVWRWALPYPDPCQCTSVIYGGANTIRPMRRFTPVYVDHPLATSNISMIMKHYNLDCMNFTCPESRGETKTDQGKATAMVQWLDPVPTDSTDYVYKATCYPPSGTNFNIGNASVVCKAFDRRGIMKTCRFDVIVEDNENPVLTSCPVNQSTNTDPDQATAMIAWQGPVATDNSGDNPTVNCDPPSGNNFVIGQTPVTCTASDGYGNNASCAFNVNVKDNEDPVLASCPVNQATNTDPGQATAMIEWQGPAATDNSGDKPTVNCDPPSGNIFVIGVTPVTCTASDGYGNSASCTVNVDVKDNEDPVLVSCPVNHITNTDPGQATAMIVWQGPAATDNSGDKPTVTCDPPSGNYFVIGQTPVTCTASDGYGNRASCTVNVDVKDNEAPSLAHCPDQAINTSLGSLTSMTAWEEPMATDNSGHTPTVTCDPPSGTVNFSNGQKHVTCTAVDEYGNQESCSFYVVDNCLQQLGMEDSRIEDEQITASSVWRKAAYNNRCGPHNARLNHQRSITGTRSAGAWIAAIDNVNQWIQVNLRAVMWVSGVMIQGRNGYDRWVTKFKVQYKTYGVDWIYVQTLNKQDDMVFAGNTDQDTVVTRPFPSPVRATVIRIQPMQWHGRISMRFDLIGCEDPEWHLVFKAVSSIATAAMDSDGLDEYDPFQVWKIPESLNEDILGARQLNTTFKGHYKSSFASDWEISNINKVIVVLLDHTGMELVTLIFNGTGSNSLNWFSKDRLLSSPYDDIQSESQNVFSVEGHADVGRRWFISREYNNCPGDTGWMIVAYDFTPACPWERNNSLPVFLYSLTNNYTKWSTVKDIEPLGVGTGPVKDSQITASSYYPNNTHTSLSEFVRLNNDNFWAPLTNDSRKYHWLQVDFLSAVGMKGIRTQGAGSLLQWVTKLSIKTGDDENSLAPIMESGIDKIFRANANTNDVVAIRFPVTIFARLLRVIPVAWHEWPAMRMEVMGYHTDVGEASIFAIFVHTHDN